MVWTQSNLVEDEAQVRVGPLFKDDENRRDCRVTVEPHSEMQFTTGATCAIYSLVRSLSEILQSRNDEVVTFLT